MIQRILLLVLIVLTVTSVEGCGAAVSDEGAGGLITPDGDTITNESQFVWKGYTWQVRSGKGGPWANQWSAANVFVDPNTGWLHLKITNVDGTWRCAELNTIANLGAGTYQWQIQGAIDRMDPNVVLGLFPYSGSDGTKEIDIEYARWGSATQGNGNWTVYPQSGAIIGKDTFNFFLSGTYTTSRFKWNPSTGIEFELMGGFQPTGTTTNVIASWSYQPPNPSTAVPQWAMPLHMNLWLFKGKAPEDGKEVEVVIHDFTKIDL